jgi:hypothetical protein
VKMPTICTVSPVQVCGCDGKTYSNSDCDAHSAGVNVNHGGACP